MAGRIIDQLMKAERIDSDTSSRAAARSRACQKVRAATSHKIPDRQTAAVKDQPKPANESLTANRLARSFGFSSPSMGEKNQPGSWLHKLPKAITRRTAAKKAARAATSR